MPISSKLWVPSLAAVAVLLSAGCLRKEVTHTVYISADTVVWSALEKDVYSDEKDAVKRVAEEQDYQLAANAGQHSIAAALRALGATAITTRWVRRERPYTVLTEARFEHPRQLAQALLREMHLEGGASLVRDGCTTTFSARVRADAEPDIPDPLSALAEDLGRYRFVLTAGRFVAADGFEIDAGGGVAIPDASAAPSDGVLALLLSWADDPSVTSCAAR